MHITVLMDIIYLYAVADYVDYIYIHMFVSGSYCCGFIYQEIINHRVSGILLGNMGR